MNRWTPEQANTWWAAQKWPVGANYVPSCAVNSIEMWRQETFRPDIIRRELTWARGLGMNSVRVFLSYTVWAAEGQRFLDTLEEFLAIADGCGMTTVPILFDDCAFDGGADPVYGPQKDPIPGVHNSRWVPSPGFAAEDDPACLASCRDYVNAIIGAHRDDRRILLWDLYNEPGNTSRGIRCLPYLVYAFAWARECSPVQPLTSCVWNPRDTAVNAALYELCDIINLHTYAAPARTRETVAAARAHGRPVIITEWLHRPNGDTVEANLPYFCAEKIGIWQWGLVQGRTQTHLNWSTMGENGVPDAYPALWQHDMLYPDGTPYDPAEVALMRRLTGAEKEI